MHHCILGLLAGTHGPAYVIATKPEAQFLDWFDPRIAGPLLRSTESRIDLLFESIPEPHRGRATAFVGC